MSYYQELRCGYPKARKKYSCEWCAQTIPIGEKHFMRVYTFEEFTTGRMHLECKAAMDKTPNDELMDGWMPGEFDRPIAPNAIAQDAKGQE